MVYDRIREKCDLATRFAMGFVCEFSEALVGMNCKSWEWQHLGRREQKWSVCYHEAAWAFSTHVIESHGLLSAHSGIRMSTKDNVRSTVMMYLYVPCTRLMIW